MLSAYYLHYHLRASLVFIVNCVSLHHALFKVIFLLVLYFFYFYISYIFLLWHDGLACSFTWFKISESEYPLKTTVILGHSWTNYWKQANQSWVLHHGNALVYSSLYLVLAPTNTDIIPYPITLMTWNFLCSQNWK